MHVNLFIHLIQAYQMNPGFVTPTHNFVLLSFLQVDGRQDVRKKGAALWDQHGWHGSLNYDRMNLTNHVSFMLSTREEVAGSCG